MTDIDSRLTKCFTSVFPTLRQTEIVDATLDKVAAWDSIAAATLLTIVSEEFGIPIDYEVVDQLASFGAIREYVMAHGAQKGMNGHG